MADNISVLVKLFETLKSSTDKNEQATQELINQQHDLVNHIKNLPIESLKSALKEHSKDSISEINECSENVDTKTFDLMTEIKNVNSKVSRMILVVVAAFTIVMGSYVVIRTVSDDNSKIEEWKNASEKANDAIITNLTDEIERLREEVNSHVEEK